LVDGARSQNASTDGRPRRPQLKNVCFFCLSWCLGALVVKSAFPHCVRTLIF
jgi:hypothetical protein